jgi:hypothetical protein
METEFCETVVTARLEGVVGDVVSATVEWPVDGGAGAVANSGGVRAARFPAASAASTPIAYAVPQASAVIVAVAELVSLTRLAPT